MREYRSRHEDLSRVSVGHRCGWAQEPAGDRHVSGTVVDSATGAPVRQALVTLTQAVPPRQTTASAQRALNFAVLTDAAGRFQFYALSAGTYMCMAVKYGFAGPAEPGAIAIQLGPSRD